jgi:carboxypeptidase D
MASLAYERTVDQPAGTGLSYTSTDHYVHTLPQATEQVIQFLHTWYKIFPEYLSMDVRRPHNSTLVYCLMSYSQTYLAGESYAGQYIPYFGGLP